MLTEFRFGFGGVWRWHFIQICLPALPPAGRFRQPDLGDREYVDFQLQHKCICGGAGAGEPSWRVIHPGWARPQHDGFVKCGCCPYGMSTKLGEYLTIYSIVSVIAFLITLPVCSSAETGYRVRSKLWDVLIYGQLCATISTLEFVICSIAMYALVRRVYVYWRYFHHDLTKIGSGCNPTYKPKSHRHRFNTVRHRHGETLQQTYNSYESNKIRQLTSYNLVSANAPAFMTKTSS